MAKLKILGYYMDLWYVCRSHFYFVCGTSVFLRKNTLGLFVKRERVGIVVSLRRLSIFLLDLRHKAVHFKVRKAYLLNKVVAY